MPNDTNMQRKMSLCSTDVWSWRECQCNFGAGKGQY